MKIQKTPNNNHSKTHIFCTKHLGAKCEIHPYISCASSLLEQAFENWLMG